ncbi:MAG: NAD+ synthase, partial [Planctomycetaceae bacterium]
EISGSEMKIALAQLNPTVGDLAGNTALVLDAAEEAASQNADLLVCSELVVCGYPPKDLLTRQSFVEACDDAVLSLAQELPSELGVLVGHPSARDVPGGRIANAVSLLYRGELVATRHKVLLPNYDVFDERRYFRSGAVVEPIDFNGQKLGVHICEDAWWPDPDTYYDKEPSRFVDPVAQLAQAGADVLINLSASPFEVRKLQRRQHLMAAHSKKHTLPMVFVNQVGGNDDLVFDGASFVLDEAGVVRRQLGSFESEVFVVDLTSLPEQGKLKSLTEIEEMYSALVLGLKDYLGKCGFTDCVLGLSGGIDSALAACIAAEAVGPEHVHALLMPSRYSSDHSVADGLRLAESLGIDHETVSIDSVHKAFEATPVISDDLQANPTGLPEQNLQARIRGAMVMVRSNQHGWLALATGNKSELAVGYCTLYGDMCGGFAVLSDLLKRDVYALSRFVNEKAGREIVPNNIINKPPSAELAPDQVDQDSLPPYDVLDAILERLIEQDASVAAVAQDFPRDVVEWVAKRVDRNEFKRRQMPPGIKLSPRAFGTGRRLPMAMRIAYE